MSKRLTLKMGSEQLCSILYVAPSKQTSRISSSWLNWFTVVLSVRVWWCTLLSISANTLQQANRPTDRYRYTRTQIHTYIKYTQFGIIFLLNRVRHCPIYCWSIGINVLCKFFAHTKHAHGVRKRNKMLIWWRNSNVIFMYLFTNWATSRRLYTDRNFEWKNKQTVIWNSPSDIAYFNNSNKYFNDAYLSRNCSTTSSNCAVAEQSSASSCQ